MEQVARLITTGGCGCLLRGLVETDAERLVFDAAQTVDIWIVGIHIVCAIVPIQCSGCRPPVAAECHCLVVHHVATQLQWLVCLCHEDAHLVAFLKIRCRSIHLLGGMAHHQLHLHVFCICRLIRRQDVLAARCHPGYGQHQCHIYNSMYLHLLIKIVSNGHYLCLLTFAIRSGLPLRITGLC